MILRALLTISVLLLILGGAFTYLARRSMALCPALGRHPRLVWGFLGLFLALMFLVPLVNRLADHRADFLYWLSYGLFGFVSTFLVYLAVADLLQFLLRRLAHAPQALSLWAFQAALGAALLSILVGAVVAVRLPRLKQVKCPSRACPLAWMASASCRSRICTWGRWCPWPRWSAWSPAPTN